MLLKKQTVWLLTMLSLVVVLSVYYITSPEQQMNNMATVDEKSTDSKQADGKTESTSDGKAVTSATANDEMFEALRLELDEERSKMIEELETTVASTDLPTDEINAALDKIKEINDVKIKESTLETMIVALDYEAALVRITEDEVRVTVKAEKHSPQAANEILKLVQKEVGSNIKPVVEFQISK